MSQPPGDRVRNVDGLRAIAALGVLFAHASWPAMPTWFPSGTRGVDLFFVISGWCLARPIFRGDARLHAISYVDFLQRRFIRIAPPYYAALALFALLALTPFGLPSMYVAPHTQPPNLVVDFVRDVLFVPPRAPAFNTVFWTLGVEAHWYVVCPFLVLLFLRKRALFYVVLVAFYALYDLTPIAITDLGAFPCFMLGILAARLIDSAHPIVSYAWIGAIVACTIGALGPPHFSIGVDPIWHMAAFFLFLTGFTPAARRVLESWPLVALGTASYSIYLVHLPIVLVVRRITHSSPLAAASGIAAGVVFWALVERPALRWSQRLRRPSRTAASALPAGDASIAPASAT